MQNGALDTNQAAASIRRILALKDWLNGRLQPDISVVGCAAHLAVADEIAARSMTLVHDEAGLLPLRLHPEQRVAVIVPRPVDLTPADTSSYAKPGLAAAVRAFHPNVDEYLISNAPGAGEMGDLVQRLREYALLVLGTVNACASANQAEFVRRALGLGVPSVVAALRLPYDLAVLPGARTYVCTYGVLEPSMRALAKALFGAIGFTGSLPVTIPHSIS